MTAALGVMLVAAVHEIGDGRLDPSQAEATVTATLMYGLAERPESGVRPEA
jgi:hypothetical protein